MTSLCFVFVTNSELKDFPTPAIKLAHKLASFSEKAAKCNGKSYEEVRELAEMHVESSNAYKLTRYSSSLWK